MPVPKKFKDITLERKLVRERTRSRERERTINGKEIVREARESEESERESIRALTKHIHIQEARAFIHIVNIYILIYILKQE